MRAPPGLMHTESRRHGPRAISDLTHCPGRAAGAVWMVWASFETGTAPEHDRHAMPEISLPTTVELQGRAADVKAEIQQMKHE